MSDEQQRSDDPEVESHVRRRETDEPAEDLDDEVEAHVRRANVRMDAPRKL